jgi:hypothetical protein
LNTIIFVILFLAFWFFLILILFLVYGLSPILHWIIKSNGQPGSAVILEVKNAGWGWYAGGGGNSLLFRPLRVKLEIHPASGPTYIAIDRFNASVRQLEYIKPGNTMQVSIAGFDPTWVASLPETAAEPPRQYKEDPEEESQRAHIHRDPQTQLEKIKQMLDGGLITPADYEKKKAEILDRM